MGCQLQQDLVDLLYLVLQAVVGLDIGPHVGAETLSEVRIRVEFGQPMREPGHLPPGHNTALVTRNEVIWVDLP